MAALQTAQARFAACGMVLERAKAANLVGVALRTLGRSAEASRIFADAARDFNRADKPEEEGAALFNRGLVLAQQGDFSAAQSALRRAEALFAAAGRPAQAAAAAREHGGVLLQAGDAATAIDLLSPAVDMAWQGGDSAGAGATANVLGLAYLATGDNDRAIEAFRQALSAHPRSVRPADYAMAKANLALAHERRGDTAQAVLAGQQALGVPAVAPLVRAQARELLERLPAASGHELFAVLDEEPMARWPVVVREEVVRWADGVPGARLDAAAAWIDGQLGRPDRAHDLAQTLLGALLELPPPGYQRVVTALVQAVARRDDADADEFRRVTRSAMARFAIPQWQRLAATFDQTAVEHGQPAAWA